MDPMSKVFHHYLDQSIILFIDDTPTHSKKYRPSISSIFKRELQTLQVHQFYAKRDKCDFWLSEVKFLGGSCYF